VLYSFGGKGGFWSSLLINWFCMRSGMSEHPVIISDHHG